jgi:hypothetical protein
VSLTWQLPNIPTATVRVVRNHLGFPNSPTDGAIVYQGSGEQFYDNEILRSYSPIYYTVFVYDAAGNVSSGAVVAAAAREDGSSVVIPVTTDSDQDGEPEGLEVLSPSATTTDPTAADPDAVRIPNLSEIYLRTTTSVFTFASPSIVVPSNESFSISVPKSAVSTNLKTILATIRDPQDPVEEYSYILRLDKSGENYVAVISDLGLQGRSLITVGVYDFEARIISRYRKQVQFGIPTRGQQAVFFPDYFLERPLLVGGTVAGFLVLLVLFALLSRRKQS